MRECSRCGISKPINEFRFRADRKKHVSRCLNCERDAQRANYWRDPESARAKSSKAMAQLRSDPDRRPEHLEKRRAYYHAKAKHSERAYYSRIKDQRPWEWRVRNLRRNINPDITVAWLQALWDSQGGRCALSGRDLDIRTAEVDHRVPRSRGGSDALENLRLLCPEANAAKGAMTDEELFRLCAEVLERRSQIPEIIGRALMEIA